MEEPKANIIQADTDEEQSSNKVYSSLQRDYRPEKKQLTPEEKGLRQVHTKKKEKESLWKSFKRSLFGGDIKNVPKYVLCNVIAPALQKMFADAVNGALGMTLFDAGQNRFNRTHKSMRSNNLFDKFYQGDSSHKQEGNGLGLALVKRILTIEKGQITAENIPEGGCRFTVTLRTK